MPTVETSHQVTHILQADMPFPKYIPEAPPEETRTQFDQDLKDLHLIYDYDAQNVETGEPEKWRYEMWFFSPERIVYKIHGGPMAGRVNFQSAAYQCIRPGELWQCNWLEGR
jgi:phenolic acid decarboxylase